MIDNSINVDIRERICVLVEYENGWKKEVNIVSWNGAPAKIDIRDWDQTHKRMSRGITLYENEAMLLVDELAKYFSSK